MNKALSILFLFALVFNGSALASDAVPSYGLEELFRLALERSERIKIGEEEVRVSEAAKGRAMSFLTPKVSLFDDWRRYSEKKLSASGQLLQPESTTSYGVRLDQSLSTSGREFTALDSAKDNIRRSGYELDALKQAYLLNVAAGYYNVLKAKRAVEITASNEERLKKHRDAAETRLRVGEATKTALLRAEAELSGARAQSVNAINRFSLSKAELKRAVSFEGEFDVKESAVDGESRAVPELSLSVMKEEAYGKRPEVRAAEIRRKIAAGQVKVQKGAYWPTVSVEGVYLRRDDNPSSSSMVDESVYGGLKLSFPVFDGGLRASDVREAKARLRQAELVLEDIKRSVAVEVESAYLDLRTQSGVIASFKDQLAFARDNYDAVSRQFDLGLATSTDVMDANTLLVTSERQVADAVLDLRLSELRLKAATGALIINYENPPKGNGYEGKNK